MVGIGLLAWNTIGIGAEEQLREAGLCEVRRPIGRPRQAQKRVAGLGLPLREINRFML